MLASMKLIDLVEHKSEFIAKQWAKDVIKNTRTPFYHRYSEDKVIPQAIRFYDHFRRMFTAEKPFDAAKDYFSRYTEESYNEGVPLHEAIYALILMRRHIWLYAEFQAVFITAVEQKQAIDSLIRTILMFDYAMYFITQKYQELLRSEIDRKLGTIHVIRTKKPLSRAIAMAVLLAGCGVLTYYYHAIQGSAVIFTHLFYIPIVLGGLWWQKKGTLVAVFLGAFLMISHAIFLKGVPFLDDVIRALMFIAVATVVAILSEGIAKVEKLYDTLTTTKAS